MTIHAKSAECPPTRPLGRRIVWPRMVREFDKAGRGFRLRPIDRPDIPALARFFREHSPYLLGSARQGFFDESFYERDVCLASRWQEDAERKLYLFGVLETVADGRIVMGFGCMRDPYDLVVQNLNVTLDPILRGQDISIAYAAYWAADRGVRSP